MAEQRRRESISVVSAPEEVDVHAEVGAARWLALEVRTADENAEGSQEREGGTQGVPTSTTSTRRREKFGRLLRRICGREKE
jgi:hypothetical protein